MEGNQRNVLQDKDTSSVNKRLLRQPHKPPNAIMSPPNSVQASRHDPSVPTDPPSEEIVKKSKLRVNAPEFVPGQMLGTSFSFMQSPPSGSNPNFTKTSSVQDRLKRPAPRVQSNFIPQAHNSEGEGFEDGFIGTADDTRLTFIIDTLTKNPEQFQDLCDIFMDTLAPYFGNILALSRAADLLVLKAIDQKGFGYTSARLCCLLEQCCGEFRAQLHLTCERELAKNPNKSGLLMFVAELYTQLHYENLYGTYLIEAFKQLLSLGGNDNVKCVCQALKLTGYSLEMYDRKAVDEVFMKLQQVKPTVTGTSLNLIDSVVNLRSMQWGHTSPPTSNASLEEQHDWADFNTPVFDTSDGLKFSAEESAFLAEHFKAPDEYLGELSDPDELCDPEPEMDEEIQAAFKDFVKLGPR